MIMFTSVHRKGFLNDYPPLSQPSILYNIFPINLNSSVTFIGISRYNNKSTLLFSDPFLLIGNNFAYTKYVLLCLFTEHFTGVMLQNFFNILPYSSVVTPSNV